MRTTHWVKWVVFSGLTALAVDAAGPERTATIERSVIDQVVAQHRDEVNACFWSQLSYAPMLEGTLVYQWAITPTGAVGGACRTSDDFSPALTPHALESLSQCITAALVTWSFPAPKGGAVDVVYPFTFSPRVK